MGKSKEATPARKTRRNQVAEDAAAIPDEEQHERTKHNKTTTLAVDSEEFDWYEIKGVNDPTKRAGIELQELMNDLDGKKGINKTVLEKLKSVHLELQKGAQESSNALESGGPVRERGSEEDVQKKKKKHDKVAANRADVAANQAEAQGLSGHDKDAVVNEAVEKAHNSELDKLKKERAEQETAAKARDEQILDLQKKSKEAEIAADVAKKSAEAQAKTSAAEKLATRKRLKDLAEASQAKDDAEKRDVGAELAKMAEEIEPPTEDDEEEEQSWGGVVFNAGPKRESGKKKLNGLDTSNLTEEEKTGRRNAAQKTRTRTIIKKKVLSWVQNYESALVARRKEVKIQLKAKDKEIRNLVELKSDKSFRISKLTEFAKQHAPKGLLRPFMEEAIKTYEVKKHEAKRNREEEENNASEAPEEDDDEEEGIVNVPGYYKMLAEEAGEAAGEKEAKRQKKKSQPAKSSAASKVDGRTKEGRAAKPQGPAAPKPGGSAKKSKKA
ncbi:MAG: hypothetical protein ACKVI4_16475 [Actinomycetales bacterium]|tara:strand:+ start:489 stop:1982 length:1494 start_codon:yes stop_codon:yes gene_type:complete